MACAALFLPQSPNQKAMLCCSMNSFFRGGLWSVDHGGPWMLITVTEVMLIIGPLISERVAKESQLLLRFLL